MRHIVTLAAAFIVLFTAIEAQSWFDPQPWRNREYLLRATDIFKGTAISVVNVREKCEPNAEFKEGDLVTPPSDNFGEYAERMTVTFLIEETYKGILDGKFVYEVGYHCDPKRGGYTRTGETERPRWRIFNEGEKSYVFARRRKDGGYDASFVMGETWPVDPYRDYVEFKKMTDLIADADGKYRAAAPDKKDEALRGVIEVLEEYQDYDSLVLLYQDQMDKKFRALAPAAVTPSKNVCAEYPAENKSPPYLGEAAEGYAAVIGALSNDLLHYGETLRKQGNATTANRVFCLTAHYADTPAMRDKALEMLKLPAP